MRHETEQAVRGKQGEREKEREIKYERAYRASWACDTIMKATVLSKPPLSFLEVFGEDIVGGPQHSTTPHNTTQLLTVLHRSLTQHIPTQHNAM